MYLSVSRLDESARTQVVALLNVLLTNTVTLYLAFKTAHWNLKGPGFGPLHSQFGDDADAVEGYADDIAERAVALGGLAQATPPFLIKASALSEYSVTLTQDLAHVRELGFRVSQWLDLLVQTRKACRALDDLTTENFLLDMQFDAEKRGWKLVSHIDPAGARPAV